MKIGWATMAEGLAQDAKGAFSLIGINQNILFAGEIPTQTKRSMLVHLEGEIGELASEFTPASLTFSVISPSGATLIAQSGQIDGAEFPFPDIQPSADIPFDTVIPIPEIGAYSVEFRITYANGQAEAIACQLHVMPASTNPQLKQPLATSS